MNNDAWRPPARPRWPFVGRDAELGLITATLRPAPESRARGMLVAAPFGVGKTRLLHEARRWASEQGLRTETVIATEAAARTPYGAMLHLLPHGAADPEDATRWHAAFESALRSEGRPPVLVVDDAHHLDPGSSALLLDLVLEGAVTLVGAVCSGSPVPAPVTALWKDGLVHRLDLRPFSPSQLGELIERALGGPVSDRTLSRLTAVSDGNVLYARELVTAAVASGSLERRDGVWVWDEQVVLAPRLVDAVWARLEALSDAQRRALTVIALADPLPTVVAEAVAAPDLLSSLEDAGLVSVEGTDGRSVLRLTHPLYGEAVLQRIGQLTRRHLAAALADAFEAGPRRCDDDLVRVVTWRIESGHEVAPATLLRAARRANRASDHELAARLAQTAVDALDDAAPGVRVGAVVELARALVASNQVEAADQLLLDVEPVVLAAGETALLDEYLDVRFWASYLGLGRAGQVSGLLDRICRPPGAAGAGSTTPAAGADRVGVYRANLALGQGRPRDALALVETLLVDPGPPRAQLLLALETAGEAYSHLGRRARAEPVWARMRRLPSEGGGRAAPVEADLQEIFLAQLEGRVLDARQMADALHLAHQSSPSAVHRGLACLALGRTLVLAGELHHARALLLDAVADFRRADRGGLLAWALVLLSQTDSLTGRRQEASRWRDEARGSHPGTACQHVDVVAADVWLAVARGDRQAARTLAHEGAARLPQMELGSAWLLHLACRAGDRSQGLVAGLREIADRVESDLPALLADHADALRSGDQTALDAVTDRFAARGLWPLAAEAATQATHGRRTGGSAAAGHRAAARAAELCSRLDGLVTPDLTDPEHCAALSPREDEVARLAATGLSNAAIAERFVVSVRTVESHLYRAFAKLGIASRSELGPLLVGASSPGGAEAGPAEVQ